MMSRLLVLLLFGCSSPAAPSVSGQGGANQSSEAAQSEPATAARKADAAPPPAPPLSCEKRVAALRATFEAARKMLRPPSGITLAEASGWSAIETLGPLLELSSADELRLWGAPTTKSDAKYRIREDLTELEEGAGPFPLFIAADRGATAKAVYATIKVMPERLVPHLLVYRDKITSLRETVELPSGTAPWVAQWLARYKAEKDALKRGEQLRAGIVRGAGTQCTELSQAFAKVANTGPAMIRHTIETEIPKGMAACDCAGVDPGFDMIFRLTHVRPDVLGQLPLGDKLPASLDADATVEELARELAKQR